MSFSTLASELAGSIPNLSIFSARDYVRRAWLDICRERTWSFRVKEGLYVLPVAITSGTVAVVAGSASVTADATAKPYLAAAVSVGDSPLTTRQFRVGTVGPVYNITDYDSVTGVLTLDRHYRGATDALATYAVYRCYYGAPTTPEAEVYATLPDGPITKINEIYDPTNAYRFTDLRGTQGWLDAADPQRSSQGQPYRLFNAPAGPTGMPRWEMWPHPVVAQTLVVEFVSIGPRFEQADDELPDMIPESLVADKASIRGIQWAMANAGRFEQLRPINFSMLLSHARKMYTDQLQQVKMEDDGRRLSSRLVQNRRSRRRLPVDGNWRQLHSITG